MLTICRTLFYRIETYLGEHMIDSMLDSQTFDHPFYLAFVVILGAVTLGFSARRSKYSTCLASLTFACLMFTPSFVTLIGGTEPEFWFTHPSPKFVSRITLACMGGIVFTSWIYCRKARFIHKAVLGGTAVCGILLVSTGLSQILTELDVHQALLNWKFTTITAFMVMLSASLAIAIIELPHRDFDNTISFSALFALCSLMVLCGFYEVSHDISVTRNMFTEGVIEARAAALAINPNFFAFCLAPFVFIAIHFVTSDRAYIGAGLMAISSLGLVLSGSRSVITALGLSIVLFYILSIWNLPGKAKSTTSQVTILALGGISGPVVGLAVSAWISTIAVERLTTLLIRILFWPIELILEKTSVLAALAGRFFAAKKTDPSTVGAGVIDGAYFYLWDTNPYKLLTVLLILSGLFWSSFTIWLRRRDQNAALSLSICCFVILSGLTAQVFWAFPVCIIMAILVGWVLSSILKASLVTRADQPWQQRQ